MVVGFQANPEGSCWLDLLFTIATHNQGPGVGQEVIEAVGRITPPLVARLQHDFLALPEALASYLQTAAEIVACDLSEFGTTPVFASMLQLAQSAMLSQSRDVLRAAHSFFTYMALENLPLGGGVALKAWLGNGNGFAATLLRAMAVTAPSDSVGVVAEVMHALVATTSLGTTPLQAAVMDASFPATAVPAGLRAEFVQTLNSCPDSYLEAPPEFIAAVVTFAKVCRLPWLRSP